MSASRQRAELSLHSLPVELQTSIFRYCGYFELFALRATCRAFRAIIKGPCFDRALFRPDSEDADIAIRHVLCEYSDPPEEENPLLAQLEFVRLHPVLESAIWSFQPSTATAFCGPVELITSEPPCYLDAKDKATVFEECASDPPVAEATVVLNIAGTFKTQFPFHNHDAPISVGDVYHAFAGALSSVGEMGIAVLFPPVDAVFQHDWSSPPTAHVLDGRLHLTARLSY